MKHLKLVFCVLLSMMVVFSTAAFAEAIDPNDPANWPLPNDLPITNEDITLTIFVKWTDGAAQAYSSLAEHPAHKMLAEKIGVKTEYINFPGNAEGQELLNTFVASGEYPDIIFFSLSAYPGGYEGAIQDGIIIDPTPLVKQYAPNFLAAIASYEEKAPSIWNNLTTDTGIMSGFGTALSSEYMVGNVQGGFFVRRDLLKKVGKELPYTIDEFVDVLKAFRDDPEIDMWPMTMESPSRSFWNTNPFVSAWGLTNGNAGNEFVLKDGKVVYSRTQDGYKEYMKFMNMLYTEKLLDPNFVSTDGNLAREKLQSGEAAVSMGNYWNYAKMLTLGKATVGEEWDVIALPYIRQNMDDVLTTIPLIQPIDGIGVAISATCKHPVEAVKFIDALYREDIAFFCNWGPGTEEYPTYEIVDGEPRVTAFITNNPEMDAQVANGRYNINNMTRVGSLVKDRQGGASNPYQEEGWKIWNYNVSSNDLMPSYMTMTPDESREYTQIMNQVNTYADEMMFKFILGDVSIDAEWDTFVKNIENMNIARAVELKEAAYARYLAR